MGQWNLRLLGISDLMTDVQTLQTPKDKEMNEMLTELAGLMCLGGLGSMK